MSQGTDLELPAGDAVDVSVPVDVAGLLTIDVDAELRKLATAQLQGPWQVPAELVRRSLAAGASAVDVAVGSRSVEIRDDGAALTELTLGALSALLDPHAPARARHEALLALEEAGELALLAIVGLDPQRLELESAAPGGELLALSSQAGASPRRERRPAGGRGGTTLRLRARGLDPARARVMVADAARFASAVVSVDGQPIARGLAAYVASKAIVMALPGGGELRGHVALPRAPGPARLWLLQHGVVVTHQALAQAPSFEATLEFGALLGPRATPADLRSAITPLLGALTAAAVELMLEVSSQAQRLSAALQAQLLALLLEAARLGYQRAAIAEAAVIPALLEEGEDEAGGAPSLLSVAALRGRSERDHAGHAVALALDPDQPRRDLLCGGAPLALLDAAARSTITELYGLRFRAPGRRPSRASAPLRGLSWAIRGAARAIDLALAPLWRGLKRPLTAEALSPEQRAFVEHLRVIVEQGSGAPIEVVFCAGFGEPRRRGGRLYLPRDAEVVRGAVRLFTERGPGWLYPVALALLRGGAEPAAGARATWRREWSRDPARGRP